MTGPGIPRSFFSTQVGHLSPSSVILVPTSCQEVPNLTPRSSKRAQLVAKIAQNLPQEPPTRPPKTPKYSKNVILSFDFRLSPFFNRSLPRLPKMLKIAPQMASRWPSWHQLGASWRHLGPNLAPFRAIWATFWSIQARPKLAKIGQDSFCSIFRPKLAPKRPRIPSRPGLFKTWVQSFTSHRQRP